MKKLLLLLSVPVLSQNPPNIDTSFGINGYSSIYIAPYSDSMFDMEIQPDNKIIAVGRSHEINTHHDRDFAVCRINQNGTPDADFANNGVNISLNLINSGAYASALQPDGKLVAVGYKSFQQLTVVTDLAIVRYNTDGSIDNTFGNDGKVVWDNSVNGREYLYDVNILPDGKILATGVYELSGRLVIILLRLNTDGSPDFTFNNTGKVTKTIHATKSHLVMSAKVLSDGKIIVCGTIETPEVANTRDIYIARFNYDGSNDNSFGTDGSTVINVYNDETLGGMAMMADGSIVIGGRAAKPTGGVENYFIKIHSNGLQDLAFGQNGIIYKDFVALNSTLSENIHDIVAGPDDKLYIAASTATDPSFPNYYGFVVSLNNDGTYNNQFGNNGIVMLYHYIERIKKLKFDSNNNIILGGEYKGYNTVTDFRFARLITNIPLKISTPGFIKRQLAIYPNPSNTSASLNIEGNYTISDPSGKIIMSGYYELYDTLNVESLAGGTYIISVINNNSVYTTKFLKG